jgi:hypothetical protein
LGKKAPCRAKLPPGRRPETVGKSCPLFSQNYLCRHHTEIFRWGKPSLGAQTETCENSRPKAALPLLPQRKEVALNCDYLYYSINMADLAIFAGNDGVKLFWILSVTSFLTDSSCAATRFDDGARGASRLGIWRRRFFMAK